MLQNPCSLQETIQYTSTAPKMPLIAPGKKPIKKDTTPKTLTFSSKMPEKCGQAHQFLPANHLLLCTLTRYPKNTPSSNTESPPSKSQESSNKGITMTCSCGRRMFGLAKQEKYRTTFVCSHENCGGGKCRQSIVIENHKSKKKSGKVHWQRGIK